MVKVKDEFVIANNMTGKVETIERTVQIQRRRFRELLPQCGGLDRLAKRLAEVDEYFATEIGNENVRNAKRELAGEVAMTRVLAAMETLAARSCPTEIGRVDKSIAKMGIVYEPKYKATQELKAKMQATKNYSKR